MGPSRKNSHNDSVYSKRLSTHQAVFSRSRGYLTLIVPGLPDGQPNISVGDKISATVNSHLQEMTYEGFIHDVSVSIYSIYTSY